MSNPIITIGSSALGLGFGAAIIAIGVAIDFALGQLMLHALGYGALAAAAGTLSSAILPLVVGGFILMFPMLIVHFGLEIFFWDAPFMLSLLKIAANVACAFAITAVGATIFGLAVNPLGLCMVAGELLLQFSIIALSLLFNCEVALARAVSQPPHDLGGYNMFSSAHDRNGLFSNLNSQRSANDATPAYSSPVHEQQLPHQA